MVSWRTGPLACPRRVRRRPAPPHRMHLHAHVARAGWLGTLHDPSDGVQAAPPVLLGWRPSERLALLAPAGAQHVNPLRHGRAPRLLARAVQASFRETRGHPGVDCLCQAACGVAREEAISRTPAPVDWRPGWALAGRQGACAGPLSTREGQVQDARRTPAPWRDARVCGREEGLLQAARVPPWPPEGVLPGERRDQPVVRHAVQAGTAVAREAPLGRRAQRPHPLALIAGVGRRSLEADALRVRRGQGCRDRRKGPPGERRRRPPHGRRRCPWGRPRR